MEIYIGAPIQHESERSTLREIEQLLATEGREAIVFANFNVAGRQIDLLVALKESVLVIEAKTGNRLIRGTENGSWQVRLASSQWKDFPNPYLQALNAALAIKDATRSSCSSDAPYIHAALVFAPDIPHGSQVIQGDRKVSVVGHAGLPRLLRERSNAPWAGKQWRVFANHLRLMPVSSVSAACDSELADAEARLRHYTEYFRQTYENANSLVPFSCKKNGKAISSEEVTSLAFDLCGGHLLEGPSGCGKSLLAASSGAAFSRRGGVAISFQAKDFDGGVRKELDREACLLGAPSASRLLKDAHLLGRPVVFIVDGYNECAKDRQRGLTRGIAGLAYRYEAGILVTSQIPLARGDLLPLRKIHVPLPTMDTKVEIAQQAFRGSADAEKIQELLVAVSSGLEARLVGEVSATIPRGSSRYGLFDAFARKRLEESASECIGALSQVAAWLLERLTFSMSVRDLDRLFERKRVPPDLGRIILQKGLLMLRGDRISFPHEMFLDAFSAEAVVRQARGRPDSILKTLAAPFHATRKDLVIGAIDDEGLLEEILPELDDYGSIKACLRGQCGIRAKEWAEEYCRTMWVRLRDEVGSVRCQLGGRGFGNIEFDERSLAQWTPCDKVFFGIVGDLLAEGRFLEEALEVIGILDGCIADELIRLCGEAGTDKSKLRTELFAISYLFPQRSSGAPGISAISCDLQSGIFLVRSGRLAAKDNAPAELIRQKLIARDLSPGQLLLFLKLGCDTGTPASFFTRAIREHWENAPYNLRLEIMHCAGLFATAEDDAERAELIEAIKDLLRRQDLYGTPNIIEALQHLGALDEDARKHEAGVLENIRRCLTQPTERDSQVEAWHVFSAQFDHPYSQAYCEVVAGLADMERKTLFQLAAKGAQDSMWLGPLLLELASFGDPAVGNSIAPWTALPSPDNQMMPQDDLYAFVVAHLALARLGCSLPVTPNSGENPAAGALKAYGAILYWSNQIGIEEEEKLACCRREIDFLGTSGINAALDVLCECEHGAYSGLRLLPGNKPVELSVWKRFPAETVVICRNALRDPQSQVGYNIHFSQHNLRRNLTFAIRVLGLYGKDMDCSLLRRYAKSREYGEQAIAALKAIEDRLVGKSESAA